MRGFSWQGLLLYLKGLAMGAADSVPGVSGGTIAFITNIYDDLLASIRAINPDQVRLLFSAGPRAAWQAINGNFLLVLGLGIISALLIASRLVTWLLDSHYSYLMCFFNGLILASIWYVGRQTGRWRGTESLCFAAGLLASAALAFLPAQPGQENLLYIFCCGALAICAMLLPGISGSFILLLLGTYERMLTALNNWQWPLILVFMAGCVCGLLGFSRFLYWLLHRFRNPTLACLLGILAGSLVSLWPWRDADAPGASGLAAPGAYDIVTGAPISPLLATGLFAGALALVLLLELVSSKSGVKSMASGPK